MNPPVLLNHSQNIALADNRILNIFQLYLTAAVLANQNLLAGSNDHLDFVAIHNAARADFDNFVNLRLFLSGRGEENTGSGALLGFVLLENNSVC